MSLTPRQIHDVAASARRGTRSEAEVDRWLHERGIRDPETRIAVKHSMAAQGELQTDQTLEIGTLATDLSRHTPESPALSREMATLFRQAGLDPSRRYAEADVSDALDRAGFDVTTRIAIKSELLDRGCLQASRGRPTVQAARSRTMTAAAERPRPPGKVLMDPTTGQPLVLRIGPN